MTARKPHIVIFNPDQWRGDVLGHMGNPAAVTPVLDEWVRTDAVSFRNAFCQNPVCTPSRCSFMSGWYPHVRGHRTMHHMMAPDEPVMLKRLKEEGYYVWWGGKNDLIPGENSLEPYCDVKYKPDHAVKPMWGGDLRRGDQRDDSYYSFFVGKIEKEAQEKYYMDSDWANVLGALEMIRNAPEDQPLCIYLPLQYPHPPYAVEEPWYQMIDRSALPKRISTPHNWEGKPAMLKGLAERQNMESWTEERWTELRAVYYAMCARVDYQFGLLLDTLKEKGIYEETAIFFFSDHGDFTGDYGLVEKTQNTFEDCLTRVPFMMKPPGWIKSRPGIRDAMMELVDFPATIEDMLGLTPKHTHFGRSLLPVLGDEYDEHRDHVFCEGGRLHGETHCMELNSSQSRDGLYWPRMSLQQEEDAAHTKAVMCRSRRYKYVHRLYESDELYDLTEDPQELHNRIDDSDMAEVKHDMKERLLRFYLETADAVPHQTNQR